MSKHGLAAALAVSLCAAAPVYAADLGGNCCADLEERINELEATTAKKGNRKVSLEISGVVNKAVTAWDGLGSKDAAVVENGADETRFDLKGVAKIRPGLSAVFAISIGQGKAGFKIDPYTGFGVGTDNDVYTREAYAGLKSESLGAVTVGLQGGATDDLVKPSVANTDAANKRLTLGSGINYLLVATVPGTYFAVELEPFNGRKADAVKYVSPTVAGFNASAAWFSDDSWDAAVNYSSNALAGFKVLGAVGYAVDKADPIFGLLSGGEEVKRLTANAGVKHELSGLFAQVSYGHLEVNGSDTDAYHVQAGIERRFLEALPGVTTLYGEYSEWKDLDLKFYGLGLNQSLVANEKESLVDVYAVVRRYQAFDEDVDTVMGGVRVKF